MKLNFKLRSFLAGSTLLAATGGLQAQTTYYWDTNTTTAGFGNIDGTWGTSAFWSTSSAGTGTPTAATTTTADSINFGTATDGYPTTNALRTVTVSGTQDVGSITFGSASARNGGQVGVLLTGGFLNFGGAVSITNNDASILQIASTITGTTGLTVNTNTVNGIVWLSGTNSYTGVTTLSGSAATFRVDVLADGLSNSGIGASSSAASNLVFNNGNLVYNGTANTSTNRNFTINGSADIRNINSGNLTWSGTASYGTANVAASLILRGTGTGSNIFSGLLADNGTGQLSLRKDQSNTWSLSNANTFTGSTVIGALGVLNLTNANALQFSYLNFDSGSYTSTGGANGGLRSTGASLNLGGLNGVTNTIALASIFDTTGGASTYSSSVTAININTAAANTLTYGGLIANGLSATILTKSGAGTQVLTNAANTYSGGTTISNGILGFANGSLGTTGNITVNGGTLRWESLNTEDVSPRIVMQNGGNATFHTNGNDVSFANAIGSSSSSSLTKSGTGKLTLSGNNTYNGATNVTDGKLIVTGNISTSSLTTVSGTATLAGTGTLGATIIQGGATLEPGNGGVGTLTLNNTLALNNTSILNFDFNPGNFAVGGVTNDLVTGITDLTLDGVLNVTATSGNFLGVSSGTAWRLFNYSGSLLANNILDITALPALGSGLSWSVDTSVANQVNLTVIPEPSSAAALLGGLGGLLLLRRRR